MSRASRRWKTSIAKAKKIISLAEAGCDVHDYACADESCDCGERLDEIRDAAIQILIAVTQKDGE